MTGYRIKIGNILCELFLPTTHQNAVTAVILLPGLPSYIGKHAVTKSLTDAGHIVVQPFYSGSFDSSGSFSPRQCISDIKRIIPHIKSGVFEELRYKKNINIVIEKIVLVGISYGASIAAFVCNHPDVSGIIFISPAITYNQSLIKSHDFKREAATMAAYLKRAYPHSYRMKNPQELTRFLLGTDLEPLAFLSKNLCAPILIMHSINDPLISSSALNKIINTNLNDKKVSVFFKKGSGHGLSAFSDTRSFSMMLDFIKK